MSRSRGYSLGKMLGGCVGGPPLAVFRNLRVFDCGDRDLANYKRVPLMGYRNGLAPLEIWG